jgi:hypothetical protein
LVILGAVSKYFLVTGALRLIFRRNSPVEVSRGKVGLVIAFACYALMIATPYVL